MILAISMAVVTSTSVCTGLASFLQAHFARIMAGMDQKDTYAVGFGGDYASRVMFPSGVARPKMLRILAVCTRRTFMQYW